MIVLQHHNSILIFILTFPYQVFLSDLFLVLATLILGDQNFFGCLSLTQTWIGGLSGDTILLVWLESGV